MELSQTPSQKRCRYICEDELFQNMPPTFTPSQYIPPNQNFFTPNANPMYTPNPYTPYTPFTPSTPYLNTSAAQPYANSNGNNSYPSYPSYPSYETGISVNENQNPEINEFASNKTPESFAFTPPRYPIQKSNPIEIESYETPMVKTNICYSCKKCDCVKADPCPVDEEEKKETEINETDIPEENTHFNEAANITLNNNDLEKPFDESNEDNENEELLDFIEKSIKMEIPENTSAPESEIEPFNKAPSQINEGYTPSYSVVRESATQMMKNVTQASQNHPSVNDQSPDGNTFINWKNTNWDGKPINPRGKSLSQLCRFILPNGDKNAVLGILQLYNKKQPFQDETNPTIAEIDAWNIEVIKHFRRLFNTGFNVEPDARLFLESRWASERKNTRVWDRNYRGTYGSAYGPCGVGDGNPHCGATFFPNEKDRKPYIDAAPYLNDTNNFPELEGYTRTAAMSEGISGVDVKIPWSLKLAVIIANFICKEGVTGHPGPFVNPDAPNPRKFFGCDWWYTGGNSVTFRGKWR